MTFQVPLPDYYSLLGVDEHASAMDIRQAFRRLVKHFHPDLNGSSDGKQAFLILSEAYYVLRDPERRRAFDVARKDHVRRARPAPTRDRRPQPARASRGRPAVFASSHQWQRSRGWAAGVACAGIIGAATFVLANVQPTRPVSERETRDQAVVAVAPAARDADLIPVVLPDDEALNTAPAPSAPVSSPEPAKAAAPPAPESWEATASQKQMPPVTAPDILAATPHHAVMQGRSASEAPARVAHPIRKSMAKRAAAIVSRSRKVTARVVRHSRAYVKAQASRTWAMRKSKRQARRAAKRHYASR